MMRIDPEGVEPDNRVIGHWGRSQSLQDKPTSKVRVRVEVLQLVDAWTRRKWLSNMAAGNSCMKIGVRVVNCTPAVRQGNQGQVAVDDGRAAAQQFLPSSGLPRTPR